MGKDKEQKTEAPRNAFSRMNYLYQAAQLMTKISERTPLSNYYNKIMKEISKKLVEKLHPDLKRTICCACNHPLTAKSSLINVKVKSHRKKRRRGLNSFQDKNESLTSNLKKPNSISKYSKSRKEARNQRPNKISWCCNKCGFSRNFLQKPYYKLWIHEIQDKS